MTTKHTPGPWTVDRDPEWPDEYFSVWYDVDGTGAEIAGRIGEEANAHLIAAAPEMLATAEQVLACWERGDLAGAVHALEGAVRKAKGEL